MTFDELYGSGAFASYVGIVQTPAGSRVEVTQHPGINAPALSFDWFVDAEHVGEARCDNFAEYVVWQHHRSSIRGTLARLVDSVCPWYFEHGAWRMEMSFVTDELPAAHHAVGFRVDRPGHATLDLRQRYEGA